MSLPMNRATIHIEGRPYEVEMGQSLLRACLSLGFDIPYFCWHPALESVGACRQCAVKLFADEGDREGKIVMSCMTPVTETMRISIDDPAAKAFRAANIEWLMLNHPHDCPVCDEGGECHLQDMTVMTGHVHRKTRFPKRTYRNQDLGPFLSHEMNRCIHCWRCVRFYRDHAGGRDMSALASKDHLYFGRHDHGTLENVFSGNLVEVCPTGVFTDKTFSRHYVRPWDLETAPSVCVHCGLGCNTIPGAHSGLLRRVRNRYHGQVNGYFLCDRGRFGYEFVNGDRRLREPRVRDHRGGEPRKVADDEAMAHARKRLANARGLVGIGSPRASLEANFALRALVGPERFYAGLAGKEHALIAKVLGIMEMGPARNPSLVDAASCDTILILGEDIANTAPMLALAVLQALRNKPRTLAEKCRLPFYDDRALREYVHERRGPLFVASTAATWLDEFAAGAYRTAPADQGRLGFAVAHYLDPASPNVPDLDPETEARARTIGDALKEAERSLIVSGTGAGEASVLEGAANIARALIKIGRKAELALVVPECNSLGLGLMGAPAIEEALGRIEQGEADTLIVLENDLFRRVGRSRLIKCLEACRSLVLLDHLDHETASLADVVLPAAAFAEQSGTLVSGEGRAQRFFQVFVPEGAIRPAWRWLADLAAGGHSPATPGWRNLDELITALVGEWPVFASLPGIAPPAAFRIMGQKIPRRTRRASGRTAIQAHVHIHEPKPPEDPDSPLAFSMEGYPGEPPAPLIPRYWAPGWNSVQAVNKFQAEVGGELRGGDPGIRLIEPSDSGGDYFREVPGAFRKAASFLVVPLHHAFGSEELSALAPAVASRMPAPYVALHLEDAMRLGLAEGDMAEVAFAGGRERLPVRCRADLPPGTAGLPAGLPGGIFVIGGNHVDIGRPPV